MVCPVVLPIGIWGRRSVLMPMPTVQVDFTVYKLKGKSVPAGLTVATDDPDSFTQPEKPGRI